MRSKAVLALWGPLWTFLLVAEGRAQAPATSAEVAVETPAEALEEVQVTGERPGPGLWKIRRGENTVYVLGTMSPLPKRMEFRSRELEAVMAQAQLLIPTRPSVDVKAGPIRLFKLYRQWRKLRVNANDARLEAVLPPPLFARFETLRQRYAPRDNDLTELRPLLAGGELYQAAVKQTGLTFDTDINDQVRKLARRAKVPQWDAEQKIDDPQALLTEIGQMSPTAEQACLAATLTRIETDLPSIRARAAAWAVGDIEALRSQPAEDQLDACLGAIMSGPRMAAIAREFETLWFNAVVDSLQRNRVAVAVTPIQLLLRRNGVLAQFAARGYEVIPP
jgi:uncharacterized protein YbaP (TraB family)